MSRSKKKIKKRIINPDLKYKSKLIQMFVQRIMKKGKKQLAYKIVLNSLLEIKNKTEQDPIAIVEQALRHTLPSVEIRSRRFAGSVYSIPVEINLERSTSLAIRWIISSCKMRSSKKISDQLANELIDNSNKLGNAVRKKEEISKIASRNTRTIKNI
uniref:Small ribosomal subunit protein uS7c n=1 Tax=Dichotomosiphon tuberosus TaxID=118263 RepID=A0A386AWT3_9CHLO|nr:ribosomal protein S7 [Dichotomosiphon tuberosus]